MHRTFVFFVCPVFCVISTKASIKDGTVTVVEDPKVPDEQLINAIHKLNYTAEVVK